MNETLAILTLIFSILGLLTTGVVIVALVFQGRKLRDLSKQVRRVKLLEKALTDEKAARDKDKAELIDGQFKLAELGTQGIKANADYLNTTSKNVIDSTFDLVTKNTDDVLKLGTENSQKVYDALVVLIQMTNGLMSALGYRPTAPDPGLEEPRRGPNYGQPPAPTEQDGLTFTKY